MEDLDNSRYFSFVSSGWFSLTFYIDMSIDINAQVYNDRRRHGVTADLVEAHKNARGKILNALDFPLPYDKNPPVSIASNLKAWQRTVGKLGCDQDYPASASKWGLAATTGAFHGFHIDCDGFGTYIEPLTGNKWWIIATPPREDGFGTFASTDSLFNFVSTDGLANPGYILEAVLLTPGSRL